MKKFNLKMLMAISFITTTHPLFASDNLHPAENFDSADTVNLYGSAPLTSSQDFIALSPSFITDVSHLVNIAVNYLVSIAANPENPLYNTRNLSHRITPASIAANPERLPYDIMRLYREIVFTEANVSRYSRIDAAQKLSDFGDKYKPQAAQAWKAIAEDKRLEIFDRLHAAQKLSDFGESYKQQAAEILESMALDPRTDIEHRINAAMELSVLGDDNKRQAARFLLSVTRDLQIHVSWRIDVAKKLSTFGNEYKSQAADAWVFITETSKSSSSLWRINAAATELSALGDEYKPEAARILELIAKDPQVWTDEKIYAVKKLNTLGDAYTPKAAQLLKSIAASQKIHDPTKRNGSSLGNVICCVRELQEMGAMYHAGDLLWRILDGLDLTHPSSWYEEEALNLYRALPLNIQQEVSHMPR